MMYGIFFIAIILITKAMKCPEVCKCTYDRANAHKVICKDKLLNLIPEIGTETDYLEFTYNNIQNLSTGMFSNLLNLQTLVMSHNNIQYADEDVFQNQMKIYYMDMSHNNLKAIPSSIFNGLTKLSKINLSHNNLENISSSIFDGLSGLKTVDLSYNKLSILPEKIFHYNRILVLINLSGNMLTSFNFSILVNNTVLRTLVLRNNKIISIENSKHPILPLLSLLDLSNNMLKTIPQDLMLALHCTEDLDNKIKEACKIDSEICDRNCESDSLTIIITGNNINVINPTILMKFYNLFQLDISHNSIQKISKNAFKNNIKLIYLNISYNFLVELPKHLFYFLEMLSHLDISNNCLTALNRNIFSQLHRLKRLNIENNPIISLDSQIFSGIKSLSIINLSHINGSVFKASHFKLLKQLSEISMKNCKLNYKNLQLFEEFSKTPSLSKIYLDENIVCNEKSKNVLRRVFFPMIFKVFSCSISKGINLQENKKCLHPAMPYELVTYYNIDYIPYPCPPGCICGATLGEIERRMVFFDVEFPFSTPMIMKYTALECIKYNSAHMPEEIDPDTLNIIVSGNVASIQENYFENYTKLEILNISRNRIESLPSKVFYKLINLRTLDISHNKITYLHPLQFKNLKRLYNLYLDHNSIYSLTNVEFNLLNLKLLSISYNKLETIETKQLPNLIELHLNNNKISFQCNSWSSYSLSHRQVTNMFQNSSENVPIQPFKYMFLLKTLNLSMNNITTINKYLFEDLQNLEILDISHNFLRELPCRFLKYNTFLKALHLDYNEIENISKCHISTLKNLSELTLNYNNILYIGNNIFSNLQNLHRISLISNRLTTFPEGVTKFCKVLQEFDISGNPFNMKVKYLKGLKNLNNLSMRNTSLNLSPSDSFEKMIMLENLLLSYNEIVNITKEIFHNLSKLQYLDLSHNKINFIHNESFTYLWHLESIDLSYNNLHTLHSLVFCVSFLRVINLSNNYLQMVPLFPFLDNKINFSYESIKYREQYLYFRSIRNLDLSNNRLTAINVSEHSNLFDIFSLNLKNNSISIIHSTVVDILILADNPLLQHKSTMYKNLQHIKKLDLENTGLSFTSLTILDIISEKPSLQEININKNPICKYPGPGYVKLLFFFNAGNRVKFSCINSR